METRHLTCIGCPLGCDVCVTIDQGEITNVSGNTCKRGDTYARKEVTHPTRIVTSTLPVIGGAAALVSVKTQSDIPKEKIMDVMQKINAASVCAPVHIGDILLENVAGTGVNLIATKDVPVNKCAQAYMQTHK